MRFTRTRLSDIVHPVSSSQLAEVPDRVRSFGGYNKVQVDCFKRSRSRRCSSSGSALESSRRSQSFCLRHFPGDYASSEESIVLIADDPFPRARAPPDSREVAAQCPALGRLQRLGGSDLRQQARFQEQASLRLMTCPSPSNRTQSAGMRRLHISDVSTVTQEGTSKK
jgi:hypothetical protein